jgi:hypothetical protein
VTDAELRALLRRWKETQDRDDGVAYLRARVWRGGLEGELVELAAHLGDEVAQIALDADVPGPDPDLRDWVIGLERWGIEASVRAAVSASLLRIPADEPPQSPRVKAIRSALVLLKCPCDKHEKEARIAWSEDADWAFEVPWSEFAAEVAWAARWETSEERVRERITAALLPWALGVEGPAASWDTPGTWDLP